MARSQLNPCRQSDPTRLLQRLRIPVAEWPRWRSDPACGGGDVLQALALPSDGEAAELLGRLGVDEMDMTAVLAARPDEVRHPDEWWLLDRSYRLLLRRMGRPVPDHSAWPAIEADGDAGRYLFVWAFLAALPAVRAYHASIGLTELESWVSLAALGRELRSARLAGRFGLGPTWMLPLIFSGVSFRLGRLAFDQRYPCQAADHPVLNLGDGSWNIHVPSDGGPIAPAVCTNSIQRAVEVGRALPRMAPVFCCHSWLMDPQLVSLLPPESNIVQFQARFDHFTDCRQADWDPIHYIFHREPDGPDVPMTLLDQLPQNTSLQKGIIAVLRAGGHWQTRTGWLRVQDPATYPNGASAQRGAPEKEGWI